MREIRSACFHRDFTGSGCIDACLRAIYVVASVDHECGATQD